VAATTADDLDLALRAHGDPVRAEREKSYLKSHLAHYGTAVPTMHRMAATAGRGLDRTSLVALARTLWDEPSDAPVFERRFLAADLLANCAELLTADDVPLVEHMCRGAGTWAIIDTLAPRVLGPLSDRYDAEVEAALDVWLTDESFWMRRVVLLTHLIPLRDGRGDWERFTRYAEALLDDREFFVAKAIGWVLRDTGRRRPDLVLRWVEPRIGVMQAVTAREAVKPFTAHDQERLRAARSRHR
jgi:3-methyladenine DNA glycosylase AlkD